jgi:hypothetical protein
METKLKQGTVITATHEGGSFWKIDDTVIFTDTPESGIQIYNNEGQKLYFPKNHDLSGCGFPEDMFETLN